MTIQQYHGIINYSQKLAHLIQEDPHVNREERGRHLYDQIFSDQIIKIEDRPGSPFYNRISGLLEKISLSKPGCMLLQRAIQAVEQSRVKNGRKIKEIAIRQFYYKAHGPSCFKNLIIMPPYRASFYIGLETNHLQMHPEEGVLFHELLHAVKAIEDADGFDQRSKTTQGILNDYFHDEEEQETIAGVLHGTDQITLCENAYLQALGLELRKNHNGLYIGDSERPFHPDMIRLDHVISTRDWDCFEQFIAENPHSVEQNYPLDWLNEEQIGAHANKRLSPLSIAVLFSCVNFRMDLTAELEREFLIDETMLEMMICHDAQVNFEDDHGGPILTAILIGNTDRAKQFLDIAIAQGVPIDLEFIREKLHHFAANHQGYYRTFKRNDIDIPECCRQFEEYLLQNYQPIAVETPPHITLNRPLDALLEAVHHNGEGAQQSFSELPGELQTQLKLGFWIFEGMPEGDPDFGGNFFRSAPTSETVQIVVSHFAQHNRLLPEAMMQELFHLLELLSSDPTAEQVTEAFLGLSPLPRRLIERCLSLELILENPKAPLIPEQVGKLVTALVS